MAFRSSNSASANPASSLVIGAPTGLAENDAVVGICAADSTGSQTLTVPATLTELASSPITNNVDGEVSACASGFI